MSRLVLLLPVVCLLSLYPSVVPYVGCGLLTPLGAMLNAHPAEGETPSFKGSMMMAVAENEEQVLDLLKKDIYTTSGVWDLENAQIIPVCYGL
jgi:hypothetical protein